MSMALIIAGGLIAFLLVYFGTAVDKKEHFAMQLLAYSCAMILIIIVAKGAIDSSQTCELVLNNTVENSSIVNITTHTHAYSEVCYDNTDSSSAVTLYRFVLGFFVLYLAYLVIYTFYWIIKRFAARVRKR